MLALPAGFLPFDPNRDNENSDDESLSESPGDEESLDDLLHASDIHEKKQKHHIGGGVILVCDTMFLFLLYTEILSFDIT